MAHGQGLVWNIISTMILHIFGKYQRSRKWLFLGLWLFFLSHVLVHMLLWGDRIICKLSAGIPPVSIQQGGDIYKLRSSFKFIFWKAYSIRKLLAAALFAQYFQVNLPLINMLWLKLLWLNHWKLGRLTLLIRFINRYFLLL